MYIVVFDLEWNMAGYQNRVPDDIKTALPFEIIEIGAVKLDHELRLVDRFSAWVRPQVYTKLERHVAELTGREEETLTEGEPFPKVIEEFFQWAQVTPKGADTPPNTLSALPEEVHLAAQKDKYFFATWSNSDTGPLRSNLDWHKLEDKLPARCLNVQKLFTKVMEEGSSQQRSITYAMEAFGLTSSGTHHRALTDAEHTAYILQALTRKMEEDQTQAGQMEETEMPTLRGGLRNLEHMPMMDRLWSYTYNPNLTYQSREQIGPVHGIEDAQQEMREHRPVCPDCGGQLLELRPWYLTKEAPNAQVYAARYRCPEHGAIVGTIRLRKNKEGTWFGQRTFRIHRPLEL